MASTREKVLKYLLDKQRCTVNELAEAVGINPISVRHHISKLEVAGLVDSDEENIGVGRPRRVYFLTNEGMEKFPSRYLSLSVSLIEQLKEVLSEDAIKKLFEEIGANIATSDLGTLDLGNIDLEQRLILIEEFLVKQGFTVKIKEEDGNYRIYETSCPYIHVGKEHPEICIVDETLISVLLEQPVEKTECVLDGDPHCSYLVQVKEKSKI
jgi:DeoR family suf operon transcriptional repressor